MDKLIEISSRLINEGLIGIYERDYYHDFIFDGRIMGIVGPRGVGKTTFLLYFLKKHYLNSEKGIYISADNLYFTQNSLLSFVDEFYKKNGGEFICIDEIHRYPAWQQEIKNIYDSYPKMKILYSGSSSLMIQKETHDLSRRVITSEMPGFSFREYLEFNLGQKFTKIKFGEMINHRELKSRKISRTSRLLGHFKDYLEKGYYPFSRQFKDKQNFCKSVVKTTEKILYEDIPSLYSLKTENLETLRKMLIFLATIPPGTISTNSLSKTLQKDNKTIAVYFSILKETGLLRFLSNNKSGTALIRDAEKIFLDNPNLLFAINSELGKKAVLGTMREVFLLNQLESSGHTVYASQSGDMECNGQTFEIGGKSKKPKQIKNIKNSFVVKDDVLISSGNTIPLYLFGFLY